MIKLITILISMMFVTQTYAADITIEMLNKRDDGTRMVYSEDIARIDVGDTITWVATSKGHNVEFYAGPDGWEIPKKSKMNKDVTITFDLPGIYYYACTPHTTQGMIGLVVVGGDVSNKESVAEAKAIGKSKKRLPELLEQL